MGDVAAVKAKVQQYLTQAFNSVTVGRDGSFSLRNDSARAFISVRSKEESSPTIVSITIPLLSGINESPAAHEYIAYHADDYTFGHLSLYRQESGSVDVFLTHGLLGDYLDEAELGFAVGWMLGTADDLDDELQAQFGGKRFHEDD